MQNSLYSRKLLKREPRLLQFLRHVLGDGDGYICVWTGKRNGNGEISRTSIQQRFYCYPDELDTAIRCADYFAAENERELYFCAHQLTTERRLKENAAPVSCLYAEVDGEINDTARRYATAIVESSPGHFHVYVKLTHALDPEDAELLNKRLAASIGADPSGWDLTQILRVPGTRNHKYAERPIVTLRRLLPSQAHDPEELHRVLKSVETWKQTKTARRPVKPLLEIEDAELLKRARSARNEAGENFKKLFDQGDTSDHDGDRSAAVFALCKHLAFWTGWDAQRMERLLEQSAWADYEKLRRPEWVRITINKAIAATPRAYKQPAGVDDPLADAADTLGEWAANLPWEGRGGPTDNHVYGALVTLAQTYGSLKKKSVVVAADERTIATLAGVSRPTAARSLERLQSDHKLIRRLRRGSGARATAYALKLPTQGFTINNTRIYGKPLSKLRNPAPKRHKRYGKLSGGQRAPLPTPQEFIVARLGKHKALLLERITQAGAEGTSVEDLARSLNRRRSNVRRAVDYLLKKTRLLREEDGSLKVPVDFEYLLAEELRDSGCIEAEEKQRRLYAGDREVRDVKYLRSRGLSFRDIATELDLSLERVEEILKKPDPAPTDEDLRRQGQEMMQLSEEEERAADAIVEYEKIRGVGSFRFDRASGKKLFYKTGYWPDAASMERIKAYLGVSGEGAL